MLRISKGAVAGLSGLLIAVTCGGGAAWRAQASSVGAGCTLHYTGTTPDYLECGSPTQFEAPPPMPRVTGVNVGSIAPHKLTAVQLPAGSASSTTTGDTCAYAAGTTHIDPGYSAGRQDVYGNDEANATGGPMNGPYSARTFAASSADGTAWSDHSAALDTTAEDFAWVDDAGASVPATLTIEWHVEGAIDTNSNAFPVAVIQGGSTASNAYGSEDAYVGAVNTTTGAYLGDDHVAAWSLDSSGLDGLKDQGDMTDSATTHSDSYSFTLQPGQDIQAFVQSISNATSTEGIGVYYLPPPFDTPVPAFSSADSQVEFYDQGSGGQAQALITLISWTFQLPDNWIVEC